MQAWSRVRQCLAGRPVAGLVDHHPGRGARTVAAVQFQRGIGVGQARRLLGRHHQQQVGGGRQPAHRGVQPGAEVEQHGIEIGGGRAQRRLQPGDRGGVQPGQGAGAERPARMAKPASCRIAAAAALNLPASTSAISCFGSRPSWTSTLARPRSASTSSTRCPGLGQGLGQADREHRLADAALAGGDGDEPPGIGCWSCIPPFAARSSRAASQAGSIGTRSPGRVLAQAPPRSAPARPRRRPAPPPSRRVASSLVGSRCRAPSAREGLRPVSAASAGFEPGRQHQQQHRLPRHGRRSSSIPAWAGVEGVAALRCRSARPGRAPAAPPPWPAPRAAARPRGSGRAAG